jgi:hypothetical protein
MINYETGSLYYFFHFFYLSIMGFAHHISVHNLTIIK